MTKKKTLTKRRQRTSFHQTDVKRAPFVEHLYELRRRLFIIVASIIGWSIVAYVFENKIIYWLLKPAQGEHFIYTTPGGGIDFLIKVCFYAGIVMSAPVIVYQTLRFIQPLIGKDSTRFVLVGSLVAGVLALGGIAFGYLFGLPVALKFLLNQFTISEITAQVTISSYLSFVIAYLAGASLIFQIPLWMYIINRIKPLPQRTLAKNQRWVILIAVIIAALINPSPRPQDLFLLALPIILCYEIGVFIVWRVNRSPHSQQVLTLIEQDQKLRKEREARLSALQHVIIPLPKEDEAPKPATVKTATPRRGAAAVVRRPVVTTRTPR